MIFPFVNVRVIAGCLSTLTRQKFYFSNQIGGHRTFSTSFRLHTGHARICIVGAGPAGFYCAVSLHRLLADAHIDLLEKLPVPFGLVRFGVAPDHPEVKNCIHQFEKLVSVMGSKFRLFGSVEVGDSVTVAELQTMYDAVVLAYGAEHEKPLNIPGVQNKNVLNAIDIVKWYNGYPDSSKIDLDLTGKTAIILGHGNVALDVARMLLAPVNDLEKTDITEHALKALCSSNIREVIIVGRRGPLQVSFTIKEFREMLNLHGVLPCLNIQDFGGIDSHLSHLPRPRKRLSQLMHDSALKLVLSEDSSLKEWHLKFLRSPLEILSKTGRVSAVRFAINALVEAGNDWSAVKVEPTGLDEVVNCDLMISSIGYQSSQIDVSVPFSSDHRVVDNQAGTVAGKPGLYACGWCATGPRGVLASTQMRSADLAKRIVHDLQAVNSKPSFSDRSLPDLLHERKVRFLSWADWQKIDKDEVDKGKRAGKPREKHLRTEDIFAVVAT